MSEQLNIDGARTICAVNTSTGCTTVTFYGNACKNGRNGKKDFNRGICHSAAANCHNEKGTSNDWGKSMAMARNVCAYARGGKDALPPGVTASYRQ